MISTETAAANANEAPLPVASQNTRVATASGDHDRDEDTGDAIGQTLDGRLSRLRLGDEASDLRERGVGADAEGANDESAAGVDRRAEDLVAGLYLDRHALAGQERLVDRGAALLDDAVGGDLLSRPDDESVSDLELVDRDTPLAIVGVEDAHLLGAQLEQSAQGGSRVSLRPSLEVAAGEDEGGHDRGHLEIEVLGGLAPAQDELEARRHPGLARAEEEQSNERPAPRRERAERDQRVHRRGRVLQVEPGCAMEGPAAPEDDRGRQQQREPWPVVELQRLDHRQQQHGQRERRGDDQPPPERGDRIDLGLPFALDSR